MKSKVGKLATGSENWLCMQIGDGAGNFTDTAKITWRDRAEQ
jgi:hypothetical protein